MGCGWKQTLTLQLETRLEGNRVQSLAVVGPGEANSRSSELPPSKLTRERPSKPQPWESPEYVIKRLGPSGHTHEEEI